MYGAGEKRPIARAEYDTLAARLGRLQDQLRAALEDAAEDMRGWSDIAEKATFAASIEMLTRRVAEAEASLAAVFPDDDAEQIEAYQRTRRQHEVDEIVARAWANADVFRHEVWDDGRFVREVPCEVGPCDPMETAQRLRAAGVSGELRVIRGERGSSHECCVASYLLARRDVHARNG